MDEDRLVTDYGAVVLAHLDIPIPSEDAGELGRRMLTCSARAMQNLCEADLRWQSLELMESMSSDIVYSDACIEYGQRQSDAYERAADALALVIFNAVGIAYQYDIDIQKALDKLQRFD